MNHQKKAVIIGAGPAGLTAAYEFLKRTDILPVVLEMDDVSGGISRTVDHKGNKIDIGGHRFFSKSDRVMTWWKEILPEQKNLKDESKEKIFLKRKRFSRILFLKKFFDYPISPSWRTIQNLGFFQTGKIGASYLRARLFPIHPEKTLEDFYVNRFGRELYNIFFRDYTEKVWGVPASRLDPSWGTQRVKGLSLSKAILYYGKQIFEKKGKLNKKNIETSLIAEFLYPKYGPGQLWQEVANRIQEKGGKIFFNKKVVSFEVSDQKIFSVNAYDRKTHDHEIFTGDFFFSSMPIKYLVRGIKTAPEKIKNIAEELCYRDFITVGLLLKKMSLGDKKILPDTWVYVQEPCVKIGRIQVFNNWSPYLLNDPNTVWIGLEYFCTKGDELWKKTDPAFLDFAIEEICLLGVIQKEDVLDGVVIRAEKTYPVYIGSYSQFETLKKFTNSIENLFLVGRNGMHRYNNQDHSMLSAMTAVDNIINGIASKENIWEVNTEKIYHEKDNKKNEL